MGLEASARRVATIVVLYLPYISAGKKLLGYSAGYSTEEHLSDGLAVYPWLLAKHIVPSQPQTAFAFYWPLVALALLSLGLISAFRDAQLQPTSAARF